MNDDTEPNWRVDGPCTDEDGETLELDPIRYFMINATTKTVSECSASLSLEGICAELACADVRMRRLEGDDWLWFDDYPPQLGAPLDMFAIDGSIIPADYAVVTGEESGGGILTDHRCGLDALLQRIQWLPSSEIVREGATLHTDPSGASALGIERFSGPPA